MPWWFLNNMLGSYTTSGSIIYNEGIPYNNIYPYGGVYTDAISIGSNSAATGFTYIPVIYTPNSVAVSVFASQATGFTYSPLVSISDSIIANVNQATGFTYNPIAAVSIYTTANSTRATGFTYNPSIKIDTLFDVSVSIACGFTYRPGSESISDGIPRIYDGYPKPYGVTLIRNPKVAIIKGKLAYKLTRKFWTTKL
jgi:hypothetical protein